MEIDSQDTSKQRMEDPETECLKKIHKALESLQPIVRLSRLPPKEQNPPTEAMEDAELECFRSSIEKIAKALESIPPIVPPKEQNVRDFYLNIIRQKLKQVPESVAETLCIQFLSMLNAEISSERSETHCD